jgi:glycosyltransferase involved in cell wall biosynthesis
MAAMPPTWTILIPTLGERRQLFERLMTALLPQLDPYEGRVRVVGWHNNGSPALPKIRQTMVLGTTTDYLSFVDDDDLVPDYYVAEVIKAIEAWPDYVGFQVQCYSNGVPTAVSYHSLEHRRWRNFADRYERDVSHINPIRTRVARRVSFTLTGRGRAEDRAWADQIRHARLLRSEVVIPRIMYHYLYSTSREHGQGSRWQAPKLIRPGRRSAIDHPYFSWSPDA